MHELRLLKDVAVPRWMFGMESVHNVSIHTFTGASENLYAAIIFLRIESETEVKIQLIQSKTCVSPAKQITIPCSELLAATNGALLLEIIFHQVVMSTSRQISTTVLARLNLSDHWPYFVFNRLTEITKFTNVDKLMYHVPGVNTADLPS